MATLSARCHLPNVRWYCRYAFELSWPEEMMAELRDWGRLSDHQPLGSEYTWVDNEFAHLRLQTIRMKWWNVHHTQATGEAICIEQWTQRVILLDFCCVPNAMQYSRAVLEKNAQCFSHSVSERINVDKNAAYSTSSWWPKANNFELQNLRRVKNLNNRVSKTIASSSDRQNQEWICSFNTARRRTLWEGLRLWTWSVKRQAQGIKKRLMCQRIIES